MGPTTDAAVIISARGATALDRISGQHPVQTPSLAHRVHSYLGYKVIGFSGLFNSLAKVKVKVGVLRPVQQPGSYWDRSSELPLVGLEPTEVTAYD